MRVWRILKVIFGVFVLLSAFVAVWWLNMEGIFMKDLVTTKDRIADSPNFVNGVAKNYEATEVMTDSRQMGESFSKDMGESRDSRESSGESKRESKFKAILALLKTPNITIPSVKSDLSAMSGQDSFVWFGHSSYMLSLGGKTLLIDPILGGNAAPLPFIIAPFKGADIYAPSDIPPVDFLIITHNHYDHLSKKTLKALLGRVERAIVPLGVGKYLKAWGLDEGKIVELDWDEVADFGAFRFHCLTARHFSGRGLSDRNKSLWASYLLEYSADLGRESSGDFSGDSRHESKKPRESKKIFFGGDSGYGAHFAEFGKKFGAIDLAFLENGQYNTQWAKIHAFPHQTLQIAQDLNAKAIMSVHNAKFKLSTHEWNTPLERIYTLYTQGKYDFALWTPQIGEIVPLWSDKKANFHAWWREIGESKATNSANHRKYGSKND